MWRYLVEEPSACGILSEPGTWVGTGMGLMGEVRESTHPFIYTYLLSIIIPKVHLLSICHCRSSTNPLRCGIPSILRTRTGTWVMSFSKSTPALIGATAVLFLLIGIALTRISEDVGYSPQIADLMQLWGLGNKDPDAAGDVATVGDGAYECAPLNYTIEVLSVDPMVLYINNFLRPSEIAQVLDLSQGEFKQSFVYDKETNKPLVSQKRSSTSADISADEPISQCLFERMKTLMGNMQHEEIEPLQVVKYEVGQKFAGHMDWFQEPKYLRIGETDQSRPFNRLATIFAYLDDDCEGGETYFPRVQGVSMSADMTKFARTGSDKGLVVRPRKGNAVFWNNLHPNGTGDVRLLHGGATVSSGVKYGLNLFSRGFLDRPLIGGSYMPKGEKREE
ncbi:hypothetical protein F5Y16DRAFT_374783 [Xylariaceae sp. FL0255]|nr:hypothetical protein F5Y16DRAFT_374783 [Xylariaceae sp. FL0255]